MNDKDIREFLLGYVNGEMGELCEKKMEGYDHSFTKRFCKRMKQIFWGEKYFGKRIRLGDAMRRVAMIAVVLAGLFFVNQVSAKVFGVNPIHSIYSYIYYYDREEKLGIPAEAGMQWDVTKKELIHAIDDSKVDFAKLKVYQIEDRTNKAYLEKWKKELGLPENSNEMYLRKGDGLYFHNLKSGCKVTEQEMQKLVKKMHLGVWEQSHSYGGFKLGDKSGAQKFAFNQLPWKEGMYGTATTTKGGALCGLQSSGRSLSWRIEDGILKDFSGFSYEVKPHKLKKNIASKEQAVDYIWGIVKNYIEETNRKEKKNGALFTRFIPEEITISMTREISNNQKSQLVPVVEFNGSVYNYWYKTGKWDYCKSGYAISLESGELYTWSRGI